MLGHELYRSLGRIEEKLDSMHQDILSNSANINKNRAGILDLQQFRHRVKGGATLGGMVLSGAAAIAGIYAKIKGWF